MRWDVTNIALVDDVVRLADPKPLVAGVTTAVVAKWEGGFDSERSAKAMQK